MSAWSKDARPRSCIKSFVNVSIWFGTSLKSVRSREPASVSVAIQPVSAVAEITNGESSIASSGRAEALVWADVTVGGGGAMLWPEATEPTAADTARTARSAREAFIGFGLGVGWGLIAKQDGRGEVAFATGVLSKLVERVFAAIFQNQGLAPSPFDRVGLSERCQRAILRRWVIFI